MDRKPQKEKDVSPNLPDATEVHRCQYDHSQQFMLVRHFAYAIHWKKKINQRWVTSVAGPWDIPPPTFITVYSYIFCVFKIQVSMNTHVTIHDCYLKVNQ